MRTESFMDILEQVYHGETVGEAFFSALLTRFKTPEQQYKLGSMLQLETEFKAKMRPHLLAHDVDIAELPEKRQEGLDLYNSLEGETWREVMASLAKVMEPFVALYAEMGASVPKGFEDLGEAIRVHEKAVGDFAAMEAAGAADKSIDAVLSQLINKLPQPD
jgi:hypothetical protein